MCNRSRLWRVTGVDLGVLVEGDIGDPVQPVLDARVVLDPGVRVGGAAWWWAEVLLAICEPI